MTFSNIWLKIKVTMNVPGMFIDVAGAAMMLIYFAAIIIYPILAYINGRKSNEKIIKKDVKKKSLVYASLETVKLYIVFIILTLLINRYHTISENIDLYLVKWIVSAVLLFLITFIANWKGISSVSKSKK